MAEEVADRSEKQENMVVAKRDVSAGINAHDLGDNEGTETSATGPDFQGVNNACMMERNVGVTDVLASTCWILIRWVQVRLT
nr:hypothetical protein CFP56_48892 [Quercus suber]